MEAQRAQEPVCAVERQCAKDHIGVAESLVVVECQRLGEARRPRREPDPNDVIRGRIDVLQRCLLL